MPLYAPWGNAVFGETLYGLPPSVNLTATFTVTPIGYDGLQVDWTLPSGPWNEMVLLRSSFGIPTSVYAGDGTILLDETELFSAQYLDKGLKSGHFYYYSLFVYSTVLDEFILAGSAQGLVISNWGFEETFKSWMPDWYLEKDLLFSTEAQPDGYLVRLLGLLGYEMDWVRSEIESLFLFSDVEIASGSLLPYIGANYGMSYEPELGMTRSRVLVKNAVHLYKNRGTADGIASTGSAFSGYGCEVTIGTNLEIQLDTAVFDRSVGHWVAGNDTTTVEAVSAASVGISGPYTGANLPQAAYDPVPALGNDLVSDGYLPANKTNVGLISATGAAVYLTTCTPATAQVLGVPIPPGLVEPMVVVSVYLQPRPQATPVLRSFYAQVDWYAENGAWLSSATGTPVTEVAGEWVRPFVVGTPPPGAVTFGRTVRSVAMLSGDEHLMTAVQVEWNTQATPGPTPWQPPRDIQVNLLPARQNLFKNPAGLSTLEEWSISGGTIQASHAMATPPMVEWPADVGSGFVITAIPGGGATVSGAMFGDIIPAASMLGGGAVVGGAGVTDNIVLSSLFPVSPGISYSFSTYLEAATTGREIVISATYFDSFGDLLSTAAFSGTLEVGLNQGQTYTALSTTPLAYGASIGETFLLDPKGANPLLLQVAAPSNMGDTTILVQPFVAPVTYADGTVFSFSSVTVLDQVGGFVRGSSINLLAPAASSSALIQITIPSPGPFEVHYLAAPLFEPLSYLLPYFDANFSPGTDYKFEGVPNESVSDYYPNLPAKLSRLVAVLPDYVPIGSTFSLITGAQAFADIATVG